MPIDTPAELRAHLELAMQVELTTVPPYLYAMYSLVDEDGEAAQLIRSVVAEEMLHAALMANLLVAVGGKPSFSTTARSISYPGPLPHHVPELAVSLEPASPELIRRVFLAIERPEPHEAPPEPDRYESLGQFYHALEIGVERLADTHDLFAEPRLERQLADPAAYRPVAYDSDTSGGLAGIVDLDTAVQAIETVIHQGEGVSEDRYADPEHRELTHFAKFSELVDGTVPLGEVRPAIVNPVTNRLPPDVRPVAVLANGLYAYAFVVLDRIYGGRAGDAAMTELYQTMLSLGDVSRYLMTLDMGNGTVAGPPFAALSFADPAHAKSELGALAADAAGHHPNLTGVAEALA